MTLDLTRALERLEATPRLESTGRVRSAVGTIVRATLPGAAIGELAEIDTARGALRAEIVGFDDATVLLMPMGRLDGVRPGAAVRLVASRPQLMAGRALLGRVLDAQGAPLDGGAALSGGEPWSVVREAPAALSRTPVRERVETGLRVVDGLLPLGYGQRIGIFSAPGAGKSTLLARLARLGAASAFDAVVVALVGERGREVAAFVDEVMVGEAATRIAVVAATADAPAQLRLACAQTATALAEYLREREGMRVLLCVDSLTRVARAQREVGLAAGEPPVRQGYPPSLSGLLARLVERAGTSARGSITAVYSVLTESGRALDDDPVADEVRGLLDGHIVLSEALAARGHFPAVDVLGSLSRLSEALLGAQLAAAARQLRRLLAVRQARGELVALGAYRRGQDPELDEALELWPDIEAFLRQGGAEHSTLARTDAFLLDLADV